MPDRKSPPAAALWIAAAAALGACGGESSPSSSSTTSNSSSTSTSTSSTSTGGAGGTGGTTSSSSASTGGSGGAGGATSSSTGGAGGATTSSTASGGVCTPGATMPCYSGPAGTQGIGACQAGTQTCNAQGTAFGPCVGEVLPQPESCATPDDDNCDGQSNEGCACVPNAVLFCYTGPAGTNGIGACKAGTQTCDASGTILGPCVGQVLPQPESCATAVDDNCDGQVNEGCVCIPNVTSSCYSGPSGTAGVGICKAGTHTCNATGTAATPCVGEVLPQTESCTTSLDDNCDGKVNEGCNCAPNSVAACYNGPAGSAGVGICQAGTQTCNAQGTAYGPCVGEVVPQTESCLNSTDDNCDGQVNEGCICIPNSTQSCYSGPAGTAGVGVCKAGTQTCNAQGKAWGPCTGEVVPQTESCLNSTDDNCDGQVNEGCICTPNATTSCYTGPAGTSGVGICKAGTQTCNAQGTVLGPCMGQVLPLPAESCNTPVDDNCDGQINEGCGTTTWAAAWGGTFDDEGFAVTIDASGNIIVGGYANGSPDFGCGPMATGATGFDALFLAKLDPTGTCLWSKVTGTNAAQINAATTDASGNVIVAGTFGDTLDLGCGSVAVSGMPDAFVAKLSPGGTCLWQHAYGDAGNQTAVSVTVDAGGNVYAFGNYTGNIGFGGTTHMSAGSTDMFVVKLDSAGGFVWSKSYGDTSAQTAASIAHDSAGNVILGGAFIGTTSFGGSTLMSAGLNDIFVAKLSPAGTHLWSKSFGSSSNQAASGVAVDASDNVVLVGNLTGTANFGGTTLGSQGGIDAFIAKFSASGTHLWSKSYGGLNTQTAFGMSVDSLGNVLLAGALDGTADFGGGPLTSAGGDDVYILKVDPGGNFLWARSWGNAAVQGSRGLAVDAAGDTFVIGAITAPTDFGTGPVGGFGGEDVFLFKVSP